MVMLGIYGAKGGSSNAHTPVEQDDSAQSIARCRMLLALGEGEFAGGLDATRIFLDGTPLGNGDGTFNFANVAWDFRPGTQTQTPIPGFPSVSSETQVNVELFKSTPYVRSLTNTQIDAIVVRVGIPQLQYQTDEGDIVGASVSYQIQIATDGGSYETMLDKTVSEKLSSLYELSHRINLPRASTGWRLRVVRLTDDNTSQRLLNRTQIQAVTEVIDANLRYPHTALLYVSFDAKTFNNIPKISCKVKGRIIRVPSNYDPINRTYSGTWDGVFKWAWSNNPAWVWFDVLTEPRFGLGRRVTPAMLDKWELYRISQRCDQLVPDGNGGTGTEPRFLFDCYIQSQAEAWTVIKDISAGFNGLTFWGNNMFQTVADMPVDEKSVQIVTRASIVGKPVYTSGSAKDRISSALVNFSDATNHYQDKTAGVMLPNFLQQSGFKQGSFSAIGCVRESEAQRRGSYIIYSNQLDRQTSFTVGLEGYVYLPGTVVYLADERVSGRVYGGRVVEYNSSIRAIKTDRETSATVGDVMFVRTAGGITERRTVMQVNGDQIIVNTPFSAPIEPNAVFVIDAGQLKLQQIRVVDLKFDDSNNTYTITGLEYNASKYDAVDYNAILDKPPISLVPTGVVSQPRNVLVTSFDSVIQGQRVASMISTWDVPLDKDGNPQSDIIGYDVQWKRDDNSWVNIPRTGLRSAQVDGVYAGGYIVRVRAIGSMGASSLWVSSALTQLTGKQGAVPAPLAFSATQDQVLAIALSWSFGQDTGDSAYTEIQYSTDNSAENMQTLTMVPYPQHNYLQSGLKNGVTFFYRARLVDRLGNISAWTPVVKGQASFDAATILDVIDAGIKDSEAFKAVSQQIDTNIEASLINAITADSDISRMFRESGANRAEIVQVKNTITTNEKATAERITLLSAKVDTNTSNIVENQAVNSTKFDAFAQQLNQVQVSVADNTAAIATKATTQFDSAGNGNATFSVNAGVTYNGSYYGAGMAIGVQTVGGVTKSNILFNADTFAVYNGTSDNSALPFAIQGGQTIIRDSFIGDGTIGNAKIGAYIQSTNWVSGVSGWRIDKNGNAEFSNGTFRGTVYATDGYFKGRIEAYDGYFYGEVKAAKIIGDMLDTVMGVSFNNTTSLSSGSTFDYTLCNVQLQEYPLKLVISGVLKVGLSAGRDGSVPPGTGSYTQLFMDTELIQQWGGENQTSTNAYVNLSNNTLTIPPGQGTRRLWFRTVNKTNGLANGTGIISTGYVDLWIMKNSHSIWI